MVSSDGIERIVLLVIGTADFVKEIESQLDGMDSQFMCRRVNDVEAAVRVLGYGEIIDAITVDGAILSRSETAKLHEMAPKVPIISCVHDWDLGKSLIDYGCQDVLTFEELDPDRFERAIEFGRQRLQHMPVQGAGAGKGMNLDAINMAAFRCGPLPNSTLVATNSVFDIKMGLSGRDANAEISDFFVDAERGSEFVNTVSLVGGVAGFVAQLHRVDGSILHARINAKLFVPPGQNEARFFEATIEDITELTRAIEEQRLMELAFETMQLGVTITDLDGRIRLTNTAEAAMHGYLQEELVGRNARMFSPPEFWKELSFERPERMGRWARDSVNVRKDGSIFPVRLLSDVVTDDEGKATGIITTCEDISDRKRMERALKRSESLFRSVVTSTPVVIFAVDMDGVFTLSEGSGLGVLDLKAGEVVGRSVSEVYSEHPEIGLHIERVLNGETFSVMTTLGHLWFEVSYSPLRDDQGVQIGGLGVATDVTARVEAKQRVETSELKYRTLFEGAGEAILLTLLEEGEHRIIETNELALIVFGAQHKGLVGLSFVQLMPDSQPSGSSSADLVDGVMSRLKVGTRNTLEFVCRRLDGRSFPGEVTISRIDLGGQRCYQIILRDISARREAIEALEREEERYRTLIETIPHGIQENDIEGNIIFSNRAHHLIHGYDHGELIGKNISDFEVSEAKGLELKKNLRRLASEQPEPRSFITKNRRKDGQLIDIQVDWNYRRDPDGTVTGFIAIITDVTERLQAEEELTVLQIAVESMDLGLTITDIHGRIIFTNPAEARMHGYSREELLGAPASSFGSKSAVPPVVKIDFADSKTWVRESVNRRKDGSLFPVQLISVPVFGNDGQPIGVITTCEDITLRKQSERDLKRTKDIIERLHSVARSLQSCREEEEVEDVTVRAARDILDLHTCVLAIDHPDGGTGISVTLSDRARDIDLDLAEIVRILGEKYDSASVSRSLPIGLSPHEELMYVPLPDIGGFVSLAENPGEFGSHQANLVELLLGHTIGALKRVRLEKMLREQALHDPLTGAHNRRYFNEVIQNEIDRARRTRRSIAFLMIDVDRFKEINDRFGHPVGDRVLKDLADLIQKQVRSSDLVVRFGGDEFLVALVEPDVEVDQVVERIAEDLRAWNQENTAIDFDVTLSVGEARWDPDSSTSIEEVLAIADRKMYIHKRSKGAAGYDDH